MSFIFFPVTASRASAPTHYSDTAPGGQRVPAISQDRARLKELEGESKIRPLTAAEETEQKHLQARRALYARTRQAADCHRMDFLKAVRANLLFPEEKEELERLEVRYPEVPCDPTRFEPWQTLSIEAFRPIQRRARAHG